MEGKPRLFSVTASVLVLIFVTLTLRADEPYARSKDYDLQHSKIMLPSTSITKK